MNDNSSKKTLSEIQRLSSPAGSSHSLFGQNSAMSADGGALAIATSNVTNGMPGVFTYLKKEGVWKHEATLVPGDNVARSNFGCSLSMNQDGTLLAVGCSTDSGLMPMNGAVYIYEKSDSIWRLKIKLASDTPRSMAFFGHSVKMSRDGMTLVIGALGDTDSKGRSAGLVYVFERDRLGDWVQTGKLEAEDGNSGDAFGSCVDFSADGATIVISAVSANRDAGLVYSYNKRGDVWTRYAKLFPPNGRPEGFGTRVAVSADGEKILAMATPSLKEVVIRCFEKKGVIFMMTQTVTVESEEVEITSRSLLINDAGDKLAVSNFGNQVSIIDIATLEAETLQLSNESPVTGFSATKDFSSFTILSKQFDLLQDISGAAYVFE